MTLSRLPLFSLPSWRVGLLALLLAGCGGGGSGDSDSTQAAAVESTPAVEVGNLVQGGASDASEDTAPDTALPAVTPAVTVPAVPSILPRAGQSVRGALGGAYGVDTCVCSTPL